MRGAFITGLSGLALTGDERAFLREARPAGLIVFARNIESPDQLRRLVCEARAAIGDEPTLVLVDQEGGRVQRLRPPHWRRYPPGALFAQRWPNDPVGAAVAARVSARLMAHELHEVGINCDCAPVLDVPVPGAHDVIGDRAYARDPATVALLGGAVAEGLLAGGVIPVIKHIPGHGRAGVDSHLALPHVDTPRAVLESTDFAPFQALAALPAAMTAHVVYSAIDPRRPASTSPDVHAEIIRGAIGFDGLLMSDDLGMKALSGDMRGRAEAVLQAGSDLALHCSGDLIEMQEVAAGSGTIGGRPQARFLAAFDRIGDIQPFDVAEADRMLAEMAGAIA